MGIALTNKKTISLKKKKNSRKHTLRGFIIWAFNFLVGYGYITTLAGSFSKVGNFLPIVLIIGAIIALVTGFGYARLSNKFAEDGGAYLYTKKTYNHKVAFFLGFWQFIQGPIVGASSFLSILWAFDGIQGSQTSNDNLSHYLYLGFGVAILFSIIYFILIRGFVISKWTLNFLFILKWSMIIFAMIIALIHLQNFASNVKNNIGTKNGENQNISFLDLIMGTMAFFFSFGGIEGIAVIAQDVKNPKKNMSITIIWIIIFTVIFYLGFWFILIGALGADVNGYYHITKNGHTIYPGNISTFGRAHKGTDFNPINSLLFILNHNTIINLNNKKTVAGIWFVIILLLLSETANKSTSRLMNGLVDARLLASMARDGMIPKLFAKKNKYHQVQNAIKIDFFIVLFFIIIFYPLYLKYNLHITDALDLYTFIAFLQYIVILICFIKQWRKNNFYSKIRKKEIIAYIVTIISLGFFLLVYEINGLQLFIKSLHSNGNKANNIVENSGSIAGALILIFLTSLACFIYYIGKKRKWRYGKL